MEVYGECWYCGIVVTITGSIVIEPLHWIKSNKTYLKIQNKHMYFFIYHIRQMFIIIIIYLFINV